jgi:hypothetical protein
MALTKLPKNAIGTGAVDASKIEDGTLQAVEISGTISSDKIATGTIANNKLINSTFTIRGTSRALGDSFSLNVDVDWQSVIIADGSTGTTGSAGLGYFIDTTSAAHTFTLPASATRGDTIGIIDYAGTFATNKLTIARNGHNIQGAANNSLIGTNRASLILVYADVTKGWLFAEENNVGFLGPTYITATGGTITTSGDFKIHTFTGDGCFVVTTVGNPIGSDSVDYLVVAGGGAGGGANASAVGGGGGGAGGFRTSSVTYCGPPISSCSSIIVSTQTYPITVGAGGAGVSGLTGKGNNGSNSVFSTITSAGGGSGGIRVPAAPFPYIASTCNVMGNPGGSGGGTGSGGGAYFGCSPGPTFDARGLGNTPPTSPPQGNSGGPGLQQGVEGGGGAGAVGETLNGGVGVENSISGSPAFYAGGGGAGQGGAGGNGGGGPGACGVGTGTAGTSNTGGGGGASDGPSPGGLAGGNGGKGIVVIRYKFQ